MNLIPESNGLYKLKKEVNIKGISLIKKIILALILLFALGFISQSISNFIGREKIQSRLHYTKVDNKKIEYNLKGDGEYTIVFDGALGTNLYQWNDITKKVREELNAKTFVYNRRGYGFSDLGEQRNPKEQAEDLKILLRKSGVSGKIILVGEEYGSLVMTNFAKEFPDSVQGMVLINPYSEEDIKTEEFKLNIKEKYKRSKIETVGTYCGVTMLLDKWNLAIDFQEFEDSLKEMDKTEFVVQKTKKKYRQGISYEYYNLLNYNESSQVENLMENKPLYIISKEEKNQVSRIGQEGLTNIYNTKTQSNFVSISDSESVVNGISSVLKESKRIEKR